MTGRKIVVIDKQDGFLTNKYGMSMVNVDVRCCTIQVEPERNIFVLKFIPSNPIKSYQKAVRKTF